MTIHSKSKILIIEDQEAIREMIVEFLEILGYSAYQANDSESALQAAQNHAESIGVVICDVVLGNVHGPDVMKDLLEFLPEIPVVYTSGFSTKQVLEEDGPATALFLAKPFSIESLKAILEQAFSLVKSE